MWDVREPDEWAEADEGGVKWMKVDVGDAAAVEKAYQRVCDEVCRLRFFCLFCVCECSSSHCLFIIIPSFQISKKALDAEERIDSVHASKHILML